MNPTANKSDFEDLTTNLRDLAYSYLEKYNPRTNQFFKTNKAFHGTNEPENIGQPTSMGCVYHFDQDIIDLYEYIPKDTLVITKKMIGDSFKGSNINVSLLPL